MATPEGAADMKLYEKHQLLKGELDAVVEEWEMAMMELEEAKGLFSNCTFRNIAEKFVSLQKEEYQL